MSTSGGEFGMSSKVAAPVRLDTSPFSVNFHLITTVFGRLAATLARMPKMRSSPRTPS